MVSCSTRFTKMPIKAKLVDDLLRVFASEITILTN